MSPKNAKRIRVKILNPQGSDTTSLAHARRYVKRGMAEWVDGALRFIPKEVHAVSEPIFDYRDLPSFVPWDSGFGLSRYPLPMQVSTGSRFPALARQGAGL